MLSDPNVKQILPKVGNRYEAALALAKRARNIENKRVIEGDPCIKDAVDIAGTEIANGTVRVKIHGKYVCEEEKESVEEEKEEE